MFLKADVISKMSELSGETKILSAKMLEAFLGTMDFCAETGESIKLNGYFTMDVVETNERNGRNPATGEALVIPAGRTVKIKTSKTLKSKA